MPAYGKRILHGGDTLWHGYWWRTAEEHWPVDIALLPINVVLVPVPTPTGVRVSMTREQTVAGCAERRWVRVGESDHPLARRTGDHA